ncbi:MAG TPA: kynureninase, partial [Bacteroidia bacterium]|nr:kynureninase [Bacteroidia bacterium]
SFYRPDKKKYKILCESGAFSSDQYAMETQTLFHGFQPEDAIIELSPRAGEHCLRMEDILEAIEKNKDSLALVLIGGVNYLTGQLFNMKQITAAAHKAGALAGFDLAHAIGNVKLELHDWDVDFAVWCSDKYLNSGPGGIAGIFIHERHASNTNLLRFAGRWRADNKGIGATMKKGFVPTPTAEGWQLSTFPIVLMAAHKAALDQFDEAGMDALVLKSLKLTAYLEFIIDVINPDLEQPFEIITPRNHHERGCQLSILTGNRGEELNTKLLQAGIIADWLEPNILRCAPVPFYNSFEDVYRFGDVLRRIS